MNLPSPFPRSNRLPIVPLAGLVLGLAFCPARAQQADVPAGGDLLKDAGAMEKSFTATSPWGGVDSGGYLRAFQQEAPIVLTDGKVSNVAMPTSVAVADLNGDKLLDLVVADPSGIIWVYFNSGTPTQPVFTSGEIIPLWIPAFINQDHPTADKEAIACNKVFVTDFNDDGKPDLIFGTFRGEVFFVPNSGSASAPRYVLSSNSRDYDIPTRADGKLWANFLSPIYVDFTKSNRRDLILGEGTYSANSIYYFPNAGTSASPRFSDKTRQVLVPGMGREHLTPQMVDWNNDGIPDIMTGERDGTVTVFLCKSNDPKKFEFDPNPITVKFGSASKLTALSNPVPVDINGDGLFDIVVGRTNGRVAMALNKGKPGEPKFDAPSEIKGTQNFGKYAAPSGWKFDGPPQATYYFFHLVGGPDPAGLTGPDKDKAALTYEPGFAPAHDSKGKFAAKLEFAPIKSKVFTTSMPYPSDIPFTITCDTRVPLRPETNYEISFSIKGTGWDKATISYLAGERVTVTDKNGEKRYHDVRYDKHDDITPGSGWNRVTKIFKYSRSKDIPDKDRVGPISFALRFYLYGKGTFYFDDVTVVEKK